MQSAYNCCKIEIIARKGKFRKGEIKIFKNGLVLDKSFHFVKTDVEVKDGKIVNIGDLDGGDAVDIPENTWSRALLTSILTAAAVPSMRCNH